MSTSSSSSEEDLSLFQSVAVSAADIAESARKEAEKVEARRRSSNTGRNTQQQPPVGADAAALSTAAAAATDEGTLTPHQDVHGQNDKCELDITSKRIAAALESILARQLEDEAPQFTRKQSAAATHPASAATAAAAHDDADHAAGVRLFKRVAPGTPCVIRSNTEYGSSASIYSLQPPGAADSAANHLHPMLAGQQRPFRSIREVIPRFNLAESSTTNSKKRHAEVLDSLAVDGSVLLAAVAAVEDTAWMQLQHLQHQQQQQQQQDDGSKKKKKRKSGLATHAALESWKHMRKHKVDGVVVEPKQHVPHDVRMATLLGHTSAAAAAAAARS